MIFQLHGFKKSSHRIFRLNNIAKVLSFLEERNVSTATGSMKTFPPTACWLAELFTHEYVCPQVKLVSIDAADVADGNSSIILGLIWNIILFFQVISFSLISLIPLHVYFEFPSPLLSSASLFTQNEVKCKNKVSTLQPVDFPFTKAHQSAAGWVVYVIHCGSMPWHHEETIISAVQADSPLILEAFQSMKLSTLPGLSWDEWQ